MEDLDSNIGSSILMRFTDSTCSHHLEIRKIIAATAHGFVPRRISPTAVAYLDATCSSLNQLSSSSSKDHVIESVVTILSVLIPQVSPEILIEKESTNESVSAAVARVLRFDTRNLNRDAAVLGLKCIAQLLTVILTSNMDSAAWSHVSYLYDLLLGFATTRINHVRKPSHVVIAEIMQSLQGSADIVPASEALVNLFERWWFPLLGGNGPSVLSNEAEPIESWFCLDVMKRCVVLMPTKFKLTMLNCFKTILELALHRNPITIRVEWILERFCLHPSAPKDVPPHLLLDLLCLISDSVTKRAAFDREGTTMASILKNGVSTVYSSNRELCVIKLPLVFDALKVLMGIPADQEDHGYIEEDIDTAAQAFKHLIHTCIDEGLINQGLDQINKIASSKSEPPQPKELTVIEKMCATIESLLGYHRTGAHTFSMDRAFEVVSTMFDKLGSHSCCFMRGTLESLADMHKFADEQFPYRKQATLLLGRLVEEKIGVDDISIRAVLTQEELLGLLADYRDLKSKQSSQLSHLKRKGSSIELMPDRCGPSSIWAMAVTVREISSTEKMTKKIKL